VPVLVRFVRLHGAPDGRAATLLRRWVWRSAVAGTRARGVSVADIRGQVTAVDAANVVDAGQQLLERVRPYPDFVAELDRVHFNHAMTKINVLGLLSLSPRDLVTGEPVDVSRLLEAGSPLRPIIPDQDLNLAGTVANRVVALAGSPRALVAALTTADPEISWSHLVNTHAQDLLRRGRYERFLAWRAELLGPAIKRHVDRMAEWGARDGRAVADIIRSAA
jgi:hypothetical protein